MGNGCETVVLRLVGVATLIGHKATGDAKLHACVGGYGPLAASASAAADCLLQNRSARIPANWEPVVRRVIALRALNGHGPDGQGKNWDGEGVG